MTKLRWSCRHKWGNTIHTKWTLMTFTSGISRHENPPLQSSINGHAGAKKYTKTKGHADMSGELYEVKMISLLFLWALNTKQDFYLASNMEAGDKFDDIVLRFREQTIFIQLKHKNESKSKCVIYDHWFKSASGDFSLLMYYKSFCKIKHQWKKDKDLKQCCGKFEDAIFILYTNAEMTAHNTDTSQCIPDNKSYIFELFHNILNSGCKKRNSDIFCFTEDRHQYIYQLFENLSKYRDVLKDARNNRELLKSPKVLNIVKELGNKDADCVTQQEVDRLFKALESIEDFSSYKQFLSQLWVCTGQLTERELDSPIREEIIKALGTDESYIQLLADVQNWWRKSHFYLTQHTDFWMKNIDTSIQNISGRIIEQFNNLNISFERNALREIKERLSNGGEKIHVSCGDTVYNSMLTGLKIYQSLSQERILIIDANLSNERRKEVEALWDKCDFVVIMEDGETTCDLPSVQPDKKLIYISNSGVDSTFTKLEDTVNLLQFDKESQEAVLKKIVSFQGNDVSLGEIVGCNTDALLADTLIQVLTNNVTLGDALSQDVEYYIPRTLQLTYKIKEGVLNHKSENSKVLFAVSGIRPDEIKKLMLKGDNITKEQSKRLQTNKNDAKELLEKKPILFENMDSFIAHSQSLEEDITISDKTFFKSLDELIKHREKKQMLNACEIVCINTREEFYRAAELRNNVHWLHKDSYEFFIWKESQGDLSVLEEYLDKKPIVFSNLNSVMDIPHRMIFVSAEPGMGKSTLVTHLAQEIKEKNPAMWVIRVNLNDFSQHLDKLEEKPTLKNVMEFLLEASDIPEEWRKLFTFKLESMENVCVLLDGCDEISPSYTDKVISIIKLLKKTKLQKLCVTTRPIECSSRLEDALSTFPFRFQPFSVTDQKNFLAKFWRNIEGLKESLLNTFIEKILQVIERKLNDGQKEFTGVPLQCMLLAEAFKENLQKYNDTGEIGEIEKFDILQLYKHFVKKKMQMNYERNKFDHTKDGQRYIIEVYNESLQRNHMESSLLVILPPDHIDYFQRLGFLNTKEMQSFLKTTEEGKEKTGIIVQVLNDKPLFIHRTFAEYFTALWLANHHKHLDKKYLLEYVFDPNLQIVRNFFDRILAEDCNLHTAVLNEDKSSVQNLLELDIDKRDEGGRTALHLAIINYIDKPQKRRNTEKWSHLQTSCATILDIIQLLLTHEADVDVEDNILNWRPLRYADKIEVPLDVIDLLLKNKVKKEDLHVIMGNIHESEQRNAMLVEATTKGLVHFLEFMFECDVRVTQKIVVEYCKKSKSKSAVSRRLSSAVLLLQELSKLNSFVKCEATLLHQAARYGHFTLVRYLVELGAELDAKDSVHSMTPLMWAAERSHTDIVQFLRKRGADVNLSDKNGQTAHLLAACHEEWDMVRILLPHVNIANCDEEGENILHYAAWSGKIDILLTLLLDYGMNVNCKNNSQHTPLLLAAQNGKLDAVKLLFSLGADIRARDKSENNALHLGAKTGDPDLVKFLLDCISDMIDDRNNSKEVPIVLAAKQRYWNIVKLFSEYASSKGLESALRAASRYGVDKMITFLLDLEVNINCLNHLQQTPLWLAANAGRFRAMQVLCSYGADMNLQDSTGSTPLHIAAKNGKSPEIISFLLSKGADVNTSVCGDEKCTCRDTLTSFRANDNGDSNITV
ncbi:uncharacterized protein [Periplaneta americana]|uniref:uncharacterized protein isoform X3 n=2 Tax=Periplaneta americana TaxID=6978 RepID=UPI0037E7EDCD